MHLRGQRGLADRGDDRADPARLAQAAGPGRRPGQRRAQDAALPGAARRRPAPPPRTAPPPQNPGHLAMGRSDHHRVAADRRAPASPLTSPKSSLQPKEGVPGPWHPRPPGPPAGPPSYPAAKIHARNAPQGHPASAINSGERSGLGRRVLRQQQIPGGKRSVMVKNWLIRRRCP